MKKSLLLLGGSGLVGTRVKELLSIKHDIFTPSRSEVDLQSKINIFNTFERKKFDKVIYCAGITNQDFAQNNQELARQINVVSAGWVAEFALNAKVPMVYLSTDAVFDGRKKNRPYSEEDSINPVNFYGKSKSEGENLVLNTSNKNLVIRLISVYTAKYDRKIDFVRRTLANLSEGRVVEGINDQFSNPTFTDEFVRVLDVVLEKGTNGILHIGSSDYVSNFNFVSEVTRTFGYKKELVKEVSFGDFFRNSKTHRGQYAWLDISKAQKMLGKELITTNLQNLEAMRDQMGVVNK